MSIRYRGQIEHSLAAMDGLSNKIRDFLADTGFDFDGDRGSNLQLMEYFQREYGLEVMALMEQEWVQEQLKRDFSDDFFGELREYVEEGRRDDYDRDITSLGSRAA